MLCENNHVTCNWCFHHIRHCPTCRAGLQQFSGVHGNRHQDSAFNFCRHFQHGCRFRVAKNYNSHACRFEIFDHISPAVVALVFHIADIAYFSLAFGIDEPYSMIQPTPELDKTAVTKSLIGRSHQLSQLGTYSQSIVPSVVYRR